jgi:hypothetical protein
VIEIESIGIEPGTHPAAGGGGGPPPAPGGGNAGDGVPFCGITGSFAVTSAIFSMR